MRWKQPEKKKKQEEKKYGIVANVRYCVYFLDFGIS